MRFPRHSERMMRVRSENMHIPLKTLIATGLFAGVAFCMPVAQATPLSPNPALASSAEVQITEARSRRSWRRGYSNRYFRNHPAKSGDGASSSELRRR